jgi:MYXO-CTERM domain-containing protein
MGFEAFAFGCTGTMYYRDFDGDGYGGTMSGYTRNCSMPMYYAMVQGDCDDSDASVHPGAKEICNHRDDNCNGLVDEGLPVMTYHVDADDDGYGSPTGLTTMDCAAFPGHALSADDCNDMNASIHPGAPEVCDGVDNNCDGLIDNGTDLQLCGASDLQCLDGFCIPVETGVPDAGGSDSSLISVTGAAGGSGGLRFGADGGGGTFGPGEDVGAASAQTVRQREIAGCNIASAASPPSTPLALTLGVFTVLLAAARRRSSCRLPRR